MANTIENRHSRNYNYAVWLARDAAAKLPTGDVQEEGTQDQRSLSAPQKLPDVPQRSRMRQALNDVGNTVGSTAVAVARGVGYVFNPPTSLGQLLHTLELAECVEAVAAIKGAVLEPVTPDLERSSQSTQQQSAVSSSVAQQPVLTAGQHAKAVNKRILAVAFAELAKLNKHPTLPKTYAELCAVARTGTQSQSQSQYRTQYAALQDAVYAASQEVLLVEKAKLVADDSAESREKRLNAAYQVIRKATEQAEVARRDATIKELKKTIRTFAAEIGVAPGWTEQQFRRVNSTDAASATASEFAKYRPADTETDVPATPLGAADSVPDKQRRLSARFMHAVHRSWLAMPLAQHAEQQQPAHLQQPMDFFDERAARQTKKFFIRFASNVFSFICALFAEASTSLVFTYAALAPLLALHPALWLAVVMVPSCTLLMNWNLYRGDAYQTFTDIFVKRLLFKKDGSDLVGFKQRFPVYSAILFSLFSGAMFGVMGFTSVLLLFGPASLPLAIVCGLAEGGLMFGLIMVPLTNIAKRGFGLLAAPLRRNFAEPAAEFRTALRNRYYQRAAKYAAQIAYNTLLVCAPWLILTLFCLVSVGGTLGLYFATAIPAVFAYPIVALGLVGAILFYSRNLYLGLGLVRDMVFAVPGRVHSGVKQLAHKATELTFAKKIMLALSSLAIAASVIAVLIMVGPATMVTATAVAIVNLATVSSVLISGLGASTLIPISVVAVVGGLLLAVRPFGHPKREVDTRMRKVATIGSLFMAMTHAVNTFLGNLSKNPLIFIFLLSLGGVSAAALQGSATLLVFSVVGAAAVYASSMFANFLQTRALIGNTVHPLHKPEVAQQELVDLAVAAVNTPSVRYDMSAAICKSIAENVPPAPISAPAKAANTPCCLFWPLSKNNRVANGNGSRRRPDLYVEIPPVGWQSATGDQVRQQCHRDLSSI